MGNLVCDDHGMLLDSVADCWQLDAELGMDGTETRLGGETREGAVVPSGVIASLMESGLPASDSHEPFFSQHSSDSYCQLSKFKSDIFFIFLLTAGYAFDNFF